MLEDVRNWLNGKRDFESGVTLYLLLGDNDQLKKIFLEGETPWCNKRLQEELLQICNKLKADQLPLNNGSSSSIAHSEAEKQTLNQYSELYEQCKRDADLLYKDVMNKRAVLFKMAEPVPGIDLNTPEKIKEREKLSIEVVIGYQQVSILYDRADYVLKTGRLPDEDMKHVGDDYDSLPDSLVKQTLDNLRKNLYKLKKKEATEDRLASIERHLINIKKLEQRWHLLKPM